MRVIAAIAAVVLGAVSLMAMPQAPQTPAPVSVGYSAGVCSQKDFASWHITRTADVLDFDWLLDKDGHTMVKQEGDPEHVVLKITTFEPIKEDPTSKLKELKAEGIFADGKTQIAFRGLTQDNRFNGLFYIDGKIYFVIFATEGKVGDVPARHEADLKACESIQHYGKEDLPKLLSRWVLTGSFDLEKSGDVQ